MSTEFGRRAEKTKFDKYLDVVDKTEKEPALKVGTVTGTVAGVLSLVLYFMPNAISDKNATLILVLSAFILPIVTAIFTRGKVWSIASVEEVVDEAVENAKEVILNSQNKNK